VAAFGAILVILFNVAYGVMKARKTRLLAAKVMGASKLRVLFDVMLFEISATDFRRIAQWRIAGAGHHRGRRNVHRIAGRARSQRVRGAADVRDARACMRRSFALSALRSLG